MLNELKKEMNRTYTENGAVTYASTESDCLDLFATIGALRRQSEDEIIKRFERAYAEDPDIAMKTLFFARDIRGGMGERRVFRVVMNRLAETKPGSVKKNIRYFSEYGRFDDLLSLIGTQCQGEAIAEIERQFEADRKALAEGGEVSLLAKWLPSANASSPETIKNAKIIIKSLGMGEADYRKILSALRARIKIIENNLRTKDYTFDYSKQPSKAMLKYRKAFCRNDAERYSEFLSRVEKGEAKLNTRALLPYELINPLLRGASVSAEEERAIDAAWNNLEDFTDGRNALAVVDGSGSMYWGRGMIPESIAMSLGIYFAERNMGHFRNHFITFSMNPRLVEIKGETIGEKARYCESFNECANTNIEGVFQLLLRTAIANKLPQEEMPEVIYIISDMEFDYCAKNAGDTNFNNAKYMFDSYGYRLPQIVFWNVESRNAQQPVRKNEQGVALVSGSSPRLFSMVMKGEAEKFDPYTVMMDIVGSDRYSVIAA